MVNPSVNLMIKQPTRINCLIYKVLHKYLGLHCFERTVHSSFVTTAIDYRINNKKLYILETFNDYKIYYYQVCLIMTVFIGYRRLRRTNEADMYSSNQP